MFYHSFTGPIREFFTGLSGPSTISGKQTTAVAALRDIAVETSKD